MMRFQSTRPLRGETRENLAGVNRRGFSIHSPLAGRDESLLAGHQPGIFSIHSPLAGRDRRCLARQGVAFPFQSTRPLRGETINIILTAHPNSVFNPLAPCGARRAAERNQLERFWLFNPLAPCGARRCCWGWLRTEVCFQSTRPLRGETNLIAVHLSAHKFSIHSPLAGRDCKDAVPAVHRLRFQSTRPLRGET